MALGSEVNDNKQQNGANNEVKNVKTGNKGVESNGAETLKKNKKQQKNVKASPAGVSNGGATNNKTSNSDTNKATTTPLTNGHPTAEKEPKDGKQTTSTQDNNKKQQQNGEESSSQQNGHDVKSNGHVTATQGGVGGETLLCSYGGKQTDSSSPSYAAAAAKLPPANATTKPLPKVDCSRTSSTGSSPAGSPEAANSSTPNKMPNSTNHINSNKTNQRNTSNQKNSTVKTNNKTDTKIITNESCPRTKDTASKPQSDSSISQKSVENKTLTCTKVTDSPSETKCDKPKTNSSDKPITKSDSAEKVCPREDVRPKEEVRPAAEVHPAAEVQPAVEVLRPVAEVHPEVLVPPAVEPHPQAENVSEDSGISAGAPDISISGRTGDTDETLDEEKKEDQELLFIQDIGFTVKIVSPGAQPFDIQVSSMELVQEIHQLLMDREDTCHRTCFSLQLDGNTLDNFAEVKNIEGLREGSVIKVVEEPYTVREARIHVRHVRDLLKSLDSSDAYTGTECSSLAFLNVVTQGDILEKKKTRPESVDCTPPDYIMPGSKERPLMALHPITKDSKGPQCIKVLTTSAWNPPPGPRKMNGDLLYLYVVTVEDRHFHITACSRGFYLNQSTEDQFNPKAATPSHLSHSLTDLLSSISPTFKRNFSIVQRRRTQKHPFERVATPYQLYSWAAPVIDHTVDAIRAEDNFSSKLGYEEHIPGQTRDWNEELQTTRELPRKNLPERLLRERAIFKVHSDFVAAATRGAMAVVDGNVMAINPGEEAKMQMFIWNNIFFSLGFDVRDHYKELGGDAAAFIAPRNDLQGVRVYSAVDLEGLYTLGTVVIDYRGFRVTAQSIIPGILEKEQEQSVIYGSIDFGKTVLTHPKYMDLLSKAGKQLKIYPHSVLSAKGDSVELCSSVECKGIVGNDGRHYILDLLRTFPPDVNFLKLKDVELREDIKALGYPIEHKHKLCCLRQELVDSFVEARYLMFTHYIQCHFLELGIKKQKDNKEAGEREELKAIEDTTGNSDNNNIVVNDDSEETKEKKEKKDSDDSVKESINNKVSKSEKKKNCSNNSNKKEDVKEIIETNGAKLEESIKKIAEVKEKKTKTKEDDSKEKEDKAVEEIMATKASGEENEEDVAAKRIVESLIDSFSKGEKEHMPANIVKAACKSVGSLKESEFDIRFNPDVYSDGINHHCSDEELEKQRHLVKEAAAFLVTTQIPTFVRECMDHTSAPMDGSTLADALHTRGINMRYLGRVCDLLALIKPLSYLHSIAVSEIILRAAKHIFTTYVQACELMSLSQAISHFLNCLLSSSSTVSAPGPVAPDDSRNSNRRKGRRKNTPGAKVQHWTTLTPKSLWTQIKQELKSYWNWTLSTENIDTTVETFNLQKISLLRSFCIKVGLQILLREYDFDSKHKVTFNSSDIMNIFPVVKHINPRASDAYNFYTTGQNKIQAGQVRDGHELITEALNLLNNVYGAMHPEIAQCLRMVARLCYVTGEHREAMAYQQKAVLMSERVNGIDHPYTITEYTHLALYCFANGQVSSALKLLYRARYLALLVCGENHPEIALLDSNISLILHAVGEYELSLRFLERAAALTAQCHGPRSLKAAAARHLLARTLSCLGDFRAALTHERETYSIYKQQLGESHEKTRESSDCLRHLTHQAVVLQKKMNDICSGRAAGAPPIHIQPPSMGSVLDMLNVINGILFVQISQQDIEHLKAEIEKRQLKEDSPEKVPAVEENATANNNNNNNGKIQLDKPNTVKIGC